MTETEQQLLGNNLRRLKEHSDYINLHGSTQVQPAVREKKPRKKRFWMIKMHADRIKAKSDRINALRKQYDAFLEEDKKRKERNDFILGSLDKMRCTTALVPVRHKPSAFDTRPAVVDRLGFQQEFSSVRDFQSPITNQRHLIPDIQVNNNEDTQLIQEISKKYILIPKLRTTTFINNCLWNGTTNQNPERLQEMHLDQDTVPIKDLKPNSHDNTDWKSKYEILNILKNEEKGKPTGNYETGFVDLKQSVPKESSLGNNQDQTAINYNYVNTDVHVETPKNYVNEFPEKDLPSDTIHYDLPKNSEYCLNNTVRASEDLVANVDTSENNNNFVIDQTDAIGDQLKNITLEYKHLDSPNIDISQEVTNYHEPQPEPDVYTTTTIADVCSKQIVHTNEENVNIQDEYPVEASSLIHQNVSVEQQETADSEQVVYVDGNEISPMQALNYNEPSTLDVNDRISENDNSAIFSNDQEFAPNIDVQMKTDATVTPQEQTTYLNSNFETVEEAEPVVEKTENQVNITESMEDFDAEQREMFYSEQTNENYPTQQGDMEHPLNFSQNEYPQNQEYAYYENTEAEAYPGELNDEEVTQQYDPSYEQQYAGLDQGSEQQQYVEQYQEPERFNDQVNSQFEVLEYEQQFESQGAIEEALDIEDGYTAPRSEAPAMVMPPDEEPIETGKSDDNTVPHVIPDPVTNI